MKTWHYIVLAYLGWSLYRSNKYGIAFTTALLNPTQTGTATDPSATLGLVFTKDGATYEGSILASAKVDPAVGEMIRAYAMGQATGNPLNQV